MPAEKSHYAPKPPITNHPRVAAGSRVSKGARHYDKAHLAALVIAIATINAFNRINATTRQVTGEWVRQWVEHSQQAEQAA